MAFKTVKGFRDLYPEHTAARNFLVDAWRRVSIRNGFVEFAAPVVEYLDLYKAKSGEGIVSELFSLTDRGGRELALMPELTPSLARMVNAKINTLPRPIKWFSIPQCFRAENPQKGRGREFLQWNVDLIGSDEPVADAECIFTLIDLLAEVGLTPADATVRLSSRSLLTAALSAMGIAPDGHAETLVLLDKREKLSAEAFEEAAAKAGLTTEQIQQIGQFQDIDNLDELRSRCSRFDSEAVLAELDSLTQVFELLETMGAAEFARLDLHVVRGLAYYTGVVYEVHDAGGALRALAGGGRYDNLLEALGGPQVGATGFGMGDMVVSILLAEKGLLPDAPVGCDCFVIDAGDDLFDPALAIAAELRRAGVGASFSYKRQNVGKQLKQASQRQARAAVIVGAELAESNQLAVKDLASGEQSLVGRDQLIEHLRSLLGR